MYENKFPRKSSLPFGDCRYNVVCNSKAIIYTGSKSEIFQSSNLGLHNDPLLAARLGRDLGGGEGQPAHWRRGDDQGQAVHHLRGGVPGRLRQRAHAADQRRLLRGSDGEGCARDPGGLKGGQKAAGGTAQRSLCSRAVWAAHFAD